MVIAFCAAGAGGQEPPQPAGDLLEVCVSCPKESRGKINIALFDKEESFDKRKNPVRSARLSVTDGGCVWQLEALPRGVYAIAAFQDENGNEQLDKTGFGFPQEPYGFSNQARGRFGPPSFDAAKFLYPGGNAEMEITVK